MPEHVFEIVFADSKWWFRSPSNETSFPSKIDAIEAALRSAHLGKGVRLRVHHETGEVEGELTITRGKPLTAPTRPEVKLRREVNRDTARSIQYYSNRPIQFVSKRIEELEQQISLEAFVYRGGTALAILALLLSRLKNRAAWIFAICIIALQLQYSYRGRSALTDILRKRGYRSRKEIEVEKYSLQALRGDFGIFAELSDPLERVRKCLDLFL